MTFTVHYPYKLCTTSPKCRRNILNKQTSSSKLQKKLQATKKRSTVHNCATLNSLASKKKQLLTLINGIPRLVAIIAGDSQDPLLDGRAVDVFN